MHRHLRSLFLEALLLWKDAQALTVTVSGSSSAMEGCTGTYGHCFWKLFCCGRMHRHLRSLLLEALLLWKDAQALTDTVSGSSSAMEGCTGTYGHCFWKLFCCGRMHRHLRTLFMEALLLWKDAQVLTVTVSGSSSAVEGCTGTYGHCFWKLFCCGRMHRHLRTLGKPFDEPEDGFQSTVAFVCVLQWSTKHQLMSFAYKKKVLIKNMTWSYLEVCLLLEAYL